MSGPWLEAEGSEELRRVLGLGPNGLGVGLGFGSFRK